MEQLQREAEAQNRMRSVLEILVLRALALQTRRDTRGAMRTLLRALEMAQPEWYVRLFADEDIPMAALLGELLDAVRQRRVAIPAAILSYAQFLRSVCRCSDGSSALPSSVPVGTATATATAIAVEAGGGPLPTPPPPAVAAAVLPLLDPLTERELEVLRLLARGASNATIAAALVVTVGTVKKHVSNACSKLAAQNRTQALARARALRLL